MVALSIPLPDKTAHQHSSDREDQQMSFSIATGSTYGHTFSLAGQNRT
ncbi:hypothetical protein RIEGSTA812A_PEG_562 [invertebrate metagenome]|uniref:Uncharacterized protein n=1 Tax=invertebrate metagenome TaxID=1711999 RepID=A0A484H5A5_9ZZZZ